MPIEPRTPTVETARSTFTAFLSSGRACKFHEPGSRYWERRPYSIDPMTWYLFWVNLDWYLSVFTGNRLLYIHADVYMPIEPDYQSRVTVYAMIERTIPAAINRHVSFVRYRLQFRRVHEPREDGSFPFPYNRKEITIVNFNLRQTWKQPINIDGVWTGNFAEL